MAKGISIGMNIHRSDGFVAYPDDMLQTNLDTCAELGIDIIRYNNTAFDEDGIAKISWVADECHKRGLKLMLCMDTRRWFVDEIENLSELERNMEKLFEYNATFLKDKVDFYQLFNEMDVKCMAGKPENIVMSRKDGKKKGEYDSVLWERAMSAVKGALAGLKKGDPSAKTCINIAWWHTAMIYEMYSRGYRWDITGLDWYSDCEEVSSIELLMKDIEKHIPDCEFMICETNFWMNLHPRYPEERKEALKKAEYRNPSQAEWVPQFIDTLIKINNPRLKSVIFYELLDEPRAERKKGSYNGEAHFGFVECDENGGNQVRKPVFYTLQKKIKELNDKL